MKTAQKSIKKTLLVGALALTMGGLTGCSNEKNEPTNSNNNVGQVEEEEKEQFASGSKIMTKEEVLEAVETGETLFSDKDVENSLLDELDLEKGYRYYPEVYKDADYKTLYDTDKSMGYYYPQILDENDSRLKFKGGDYYYKLVFGGEMSLLEPVEYIEKDGNWYKTHFLLKTDDNIGNKVVNEEKIQELNNSKKH